MKVNENIKFDVAIGWDWADRGHRLCLKVLSDGQTECLELAHRVEDLKAWMSEIGRRFGGQKIAVAIEQSRGSLIDVFLQFDFFVVFPINSATISNYRKALRSSGAKDDPSDAELLVDFLLSHSHKLRTLKPDDKVTIKLRALVEYRRKSVNEVSSLTRQLQAALKLYYPQALEWLPDLSSKMAYDFLMKWPSPQMARKARPQTLRHFFQAHNCRIHDSIQKRIDAIGSVEPLSWNEGLVSASVIIVRSLVEKIHTANKCVALLDKEISGLYSNHQDVELYDSLPGAGPVLEPRLAVAMGIDRSRYENAVELQQFSGTAPVTVRSGNSKWVHWRWACPKFMRQTFVEYAGCSLPRCAWANECYQRAKARGKGHHAALRIVAYKWQRIIFRCWKDRVPYDEQKYLSRLKRSQLQSPDSQSHKIRNASGMASAGQIIRDLQMKIKSAAGTKSVQKTPRGTNKTT